MPTEISSNVPPHAPLAGIRILDLSAYIAGPYGCALLADLGAEVIKVEPPVGDNLRKYPSTLPAESRAFLGVNRGKRGIALDLKNQAGLEALFRLVREADVFVHNFRPDVPARLGIDYETLRKHNEKLIYCAVSGYGELGPYRKKAGYDQVLQSMAGLCVMQGKPGTPEIVYGSVVDYYAASLLSSAVSAALFRRERCGEGSFVGVSLLRSALAMQSARLVWSDDEGRDVYRDMRSGGITGLHPTREGSLYVSANTAHFWQALCEMTGMVDLVDDARYDTVRKRAENAPVLIARLREALQARTALEWEALFGERVPCAAARSVEDVFDDPQVAAEAMISRYDHPEAGGYRGLSGAFKFAEGAEDGPVQHHPRPAPLFGQHTDEVLAEHGFSPDDIDRLREAKAAL
jgi:crotonobetainyl-CoA:carnitine CoA-transferase CaiB-like acyl-CoA transferase